MKFRNQNIPVNKGKMSGAGAFTFMGKVSRLPKAEWEAENDFYIFSYLGKVEKNVWSDKLHKWWKGGNPSRSGRKHSRHSSVLGMRRWEGVTCLSLWLEGAWQLGECRRVPEGPEKTGRGCQLQVEALGQDAYMGIKSYLRVFQGESKMIKVVEIKIIWGEIFMTDLKEK